MIARSLRRIERELHAGRVEPAARLVRQVLAAQPNNALALFYRSAIAFRRGDLVAAEAALREVVRLRPDHAEAHSNFGVVLRAQGKIEAAIAAFRQAIALEPGLADAQRQLAKSLHGIGQTEAAIAAYQTALRLEPEDAETLTSLGNTFVAAGQLGEAAAAWQDALRLRPDSADVHSNLGILLRRQGRLEEAVAAYRRAIELKPDFPEAYNNLGNALRDQGQHNEAMAAFEHALNLNPNYAEACDNLGLALLARGQPREAAAAFERALQVRPDFASAWVNLAGALQEAGDSAAALDACRRALAIDPEFAAAHTGLGDVLRAQGNLAEAVVAYRRAIELAPLLPEAHNNLGAALVEAREPAAAAACFEQALVLRPHFAEALVNLGVALVDQDRFAEAIDNYDRALVLAPNLPQAHSNRGNAFYQQGRLDEAIACYDRALALDANYADAHNNKALALLVDGKLTAGWDEYEWRTSLRGHNFAWPRWEGERLPGKTLLVWSEQGQGDTLNFCRYLGLIRERVAELVFEVQPSLLRLMQANFPQCRVVPRGAELPPIDAYIPLLSLPRLLATQLDSIPAATPSLQADPAATEEWRRRLAGPRLKVGLVWAGTPGHQNDRRRSLALAAFGDLLALPGVDFYSLQVGERSRDITEADKSRLHDLSPLIADFADTAAIVANLDLVITADTSVAHLAGALGRPVWVLIPYAPDWRWLRGRDDSPWYPTARLFRQPRLGDWADVLDRVAAELAKLANQTAPASGREAAAIGAIDAAAMTQAALAAYGRGDIAEAERLARGAIAADADYFDAQHLLAVIAARICQREAALEAFDRALRLRPDDPQALSNRSVVLGELGRFAEALACLDRALASRSDFPEAWSNRGNALRGLLRHDEALANYDRALALQPLYPEAWSNRGNALYDTRRFEEALASYDRALAINPGYAPALSNRGVVLSALRRQEEALASFDKALSIEPHYADCHHNRGLLLLLHGRFAEGWREYEWRRRLGSWVARAFDAPEWQGGDLRGKRLLLYAEQGLGDTIQFARFAPLLASRGATVLLAVQPALRALLRSLPGVAAVLSDGDALPDFDCQLPLMSVPHVCGLGEAQLAGDIPYLAADPARVESWGRRLPPGAVRVGIAWQGDPRRRIDLGRSISLAAFAPLAGIAGVRLISLQKHWGVEQLADPPPGLEVESLGDAFDAGPDGFLDTAAVMMQLDLVITSDSAVAHLAGALGRPVWLALKDVPDWRWQVDRPDCPWYPSARLFRQDRRDDWSAVFQCIAAALRRWAAPP
ncbi:MAG TPA: tetratricopeptide repeat protein [Stellaceae bacterium]|nr:tetratricopeptide repeat protein [Stellaceae bacterium]